MKTRITFKGKEHSLVGRHIEAGRFAPGFTALNREGAPVSFADFNGKVKLITSYLSLDTPVCKKQALQFNREAADLSDDVAVCGISRDLPFAINRFADEHDIGDVLLLSDHRESEFGLNYGALIKDLRLLTRAVFIVDKKNTVRYVQWVDEISDAPDYADAQQALENVLREPERESGEDWMANCVPCESAEAGIDKTEADTLIREVNGWDMKEYKTLSKEFSFDGFDNAKLFYDVLAMIARQLNHHPDLCHSYSTVRVSLSTHKVEALTPNDFLFARLIDELKVS
ncbi:MAG: thiol peroxidase [Candidatus Omnitrophota bacterium]